MKSPPVQHRDSEARDLVEAFIKGDDTETLVGTETPKARKLRKLAGAKPASVTGPKAAAVSR